MDGVVAFFTDPANWTGDTGIPNRVRNARNSSSFIFFC